MLHIQYLETNSFSSFTGIGEKCNSGTDPPGKMVIIFETKFLRYSDINNMSGIISQVDNDPEFISKRLDQWAYFNRIELDSIRQGKPTDNGIIKAFNRR